jgi:RNA-directed DNA polymerase
VSLPVLVARLNEYLRGWGEYFKRAQCSGVLDRMDKWVARRVRAYRAKHWRNTLWRRYPDQYLYGTLGLTCLYALRRDFLREFAARRQTGNRPVERSAGNPHATFVRGTEAPC